jgi:hypothetical protein
MSRARAIAFYLPQFHPIPENDKWWGAGFTEWTNVTKARPLFPGHYQPQLPRDLGFYDLRVPEVREAQAMLARKHGIEGFCYWHYWFAGERLLERPFQEVLDSKEPDFPFCLGWANHTWSGMWSGGDEKRIIKEQTYPGREDDRRHFEFLLSAFRDSRYVRVEGKPLLVIYRPFELPNPRTMLDYWRELADRAGLAGLHVVATLEYHERNWDARAHGFDAITVWPLGRVLNEAGSCLRLSRLKRRLKNRKSLQSFAEKLYPGLNKVYNYEEVIDLLVCSEKFDLPHHPMAIPNWDTTARYDRKAIIFHNSTPDAFRRHLRDVLGQVEDRPAEQRIVFLKSWNEWAEGNYLEPDARHGDRYLRVISEELDRVKSKCGAEDVSVTEIAAK